MKNKKDLIFATEFIRQSNLIENINIPFEEIWKGWGGDPLKGHVRALVSAVIESLQKITLTEEIICLWQKLIIQEQNSLEILPEKLIGEREIGQYRECGVYIGTRSCMPARAVPICMEHLVEEVCYFQKQIGLKTKEEIMGRIADFHFEFLWIHPFVDGNGRTARILTWYLFKYFELKPFIFTNDDKNETYYRAFDGMREYFMQKSRA